MSYFYGSEKSRFVNNKHQDSNEFNACVENIISELNKCGNGDGSYDRKCKYIIDELDKLPRKPNGKIATIPQYIRLGIYYIAFSEYIKNINNKDNKKKAFRQDVFLKKLELSKNTFQKWELYPQKDAAIYYKEIFNPTLVRNGVKRGELCRMIQCLLTSQEAEYFADVFGGMSAVTSNVSSYFNRSSFLNEIDIVLFNMLKCIQSDKKAMLRRCREIFTDISNLKDKNNEMIKFGEDYQADGYYGAYREDFLPQLFGFYQGAYKHVFPDQYSEKSKSTFYYYLEDLESAEIPDKKKMEWKTIIAAYTYFVFSFRVSAPVSDVGISGVDENKFYKFIKDLKCEISEEKYNNRVINNARFDNKQWEDVTVSYSKKTSESEIYRWSDSLKGIELTRKDYRDFYDYVSSKLKNDKDKIIWYFDPPYFLTSQYKNTFSDEDHVELINTLKKISNKGGKWVFSCKDENTNESETQRVSKYRRGENGKGAIIENFKIYFAGFLDNVTFVKNETGEKYVLKFRCKRVKNHRLYVYKLKDEGFKEILITNFDYPLSMVSLLNPLLPKNNKIPEFIKEDFRTHFDKMFDGIRAKI